MADSDAPAIPDFFMFNTFRKIGETYFSPSAEDRYLAAEEALALSPAPVTNPDRVVNTPVVDESARRMETAAWNYFMDLAQLRDSVGGVYATQAEKEAIIYRLLDGDESALTEIAAITGLRHDGERVFATLQDRSEAARDSGAAFGSIAAEINPINGKRTREDRHSPFAIIEQVALSSSAGATETGRIQQEDGSLLFKPGATSLYGLAVTNVLRELGFDIVLGTYDNLQYKLVLPTVTEEAPAPAEEILVAEEEVSDEALHGIWASARGTATEPVGGVLAPALSTDDIIAAIVARREADRAAAALAAVASNDAAADSYQVAAADETPPEAAPAAAWPEFHEVIGGEALLRIVAMEQYEGLVARMAEAMSEGTSKEEARNALLAKIAEINGIADIDRIYAGQKLFLPTGADMNMAMFERITRDQLSPGGSSIVLGDITETDPQTLFAEAPSSITTASLGPVQAAR